MNPGQYLAFLFMCAATQGADACDGLAAPPIQSGIDAASDPGAAVSVLPGIRSEPLSLGAMRRPATGPVAVAQSGTDSRPAVNYREPLRVYETVHLGAWTVWVEKQLMQDDEALARKALARLERKLCALDAIIPEPALPHLHRMAIYLMYGEKANQGGLASGASYYKQNAPEFQKNIDLRWRNCVVIKSAENYAKLPEQWSIKVLMHELAHAFQLQQWPEKQPDILRAWNHAKQQGLYRNVIGQQGGRQAQAYAMTNQLEYFAELSCMYFVGCNYFPFTREELKRYDPSGYDMIERMWRVGPTAELEDSERM